MACLNINLKRKWSLMLLIALFRQSNAQIVLSKFRYKE
ncbi:hypothetical protein EPYR_03652 [Erwinia pyrifoliae DSM 12163]|nr:hypothetical protein EPYR_03652 [Erwinia pyrifoliae DSM 12163]